MSIKKFVSTIFALVLITGLLAACASPTPTATTVPATAVPVQPTATTAPTSAPVTLSYLVSQGWASDAEIALSKQFTQKPASPLTSRLSRLTNTLTS